MKFWLSNRDPENWRDKREHFVSTGSLDGLSPDQPEEVRRLAAIQLLESADPGGGRGEEAE